MNLSYAIVFVCFLVSGIGLCASTSFPNDDDDYNLDVTRRAQLSRELSLAKCSSNKIKTPIYFHNANYGYKYTGDKKTFSKERKTKGDILFNTASKTYKRRKYYEQCEFEKNGPQPVVFICNGRSGSSNTWMTLSKLAGTPSQALETVGSDSVKIKKFMKTIGSEEAGKWFVREHLCEISRHWCKSKIVGFQWKPYGNSLQSPAGKGMLKSISRYRMDYNGKKIRVLYMTRNPIDVLLSRVKHRGSHVAVHCSSRDTKCRKKHSMKIIIPPNVAMAFLQEYFRNHLSVVNALEKEGIEYYYTTYEKLYNSEDADEWMKIFKYLGKGPTKGLTMKKVRRASSLAKIMKVSRKDQIENYEEIETLLNGTKYHQYLYE